MPDIDLEEAVAVVELFASRLEANQQRLNDLNVFPVADADTGTNMARSLGVIVARLHEVADLESAARSVEEAALEGRGNSGLIVGQYLAGWFSVVTGERLDVAPGLVAAAARARLAVGSPVEGTMLTVADVAAKAAESPLSELVGAVDAAVEQTTEQMPLLAEHGVVDSGAAGLALFFGALHDVLRAEILPAPRVIVCEVGLGVDGPPAGDVVAHEIQFLVPRPAVEVDEVRELLATLGTDVVVGVTSSQISAHVHVDDPVAATSAISEAFEHRTGMRAISYRVEPIIEAAGHP